MPDVSTVSGSHLYIARPGKNVPNNNDDKSSEIIVSDINLKSNIETKYVVAADADTITAFYPDGRPFILDGRPFILNVPKDQSEVSEVIEKRVLRMEEKIEAAQTKKSSRKQIEENIKAMKYLMYEKEPHNGVKILAVGATAVVTVTLLFL